MSTATIFLEDGLHQRIAAAAAAQEKVSMTSSSLPLSKAVEQAEVEGETFREADERWGQLLATGKTVPCGEAKQYLAARAQGIAAKKPTANKLGNARRS